ncbi:hypothetical protein QVD17_26154 [Tagetes erecta]|uniref:DUF7880 domain-containing protein n=1 Tax=Tagetes erecta TaxID=13708 RepID=A0AAD8NQ23_TARER|nr:hypothetical protein QVD17_26154 [Tagetes erecta]
MTTTTTTTNAHFSTSHFNSRFRLNNVPQLTPVRKLKTLTARCSLFSDEQRQSRRLISISLVLFHCLNLPKDAVAGSPFDKYMKRKKLEPLESYVPAIILTEMQIEELGKTLETDQPQFAACRSLLRAGPAASLRMNIRAVAQYANEVGNDQNASNDVDQCLRALEELDSLLLHASRNDRGASVKTMKSNISIAVSAINSLLQTVPADVLEKGKAIADAYNTPEEDYPPQNLDPKLKQLESIL